MNAVMKNPGGRPLLLGAIVMLGLCSCGTAGPSSNVPSSSVGTTAAPPSAEAAGPTSSAGAANGPSAATKMVCAQETQDNVTKILALTTPAVTKDSWSQELYTCTYQLAGGPLVLSVKESADPAAAHTYFTELQKTLGATKPIDGLANLGLPAYKTDAGQVVFVKDSMTLDVDASALPSAVGPHGITPGALAYEIATAVLACWSGA
jgi:hypothetical protein